MGPRTRAMAFIGALVSLALSTPSSALAATPVDPAPSAAETSDGQTVIRALPVGTSRIAGYDRYQTSIETSKLYNPGVPVVFVSLGTNFPDALSASAAAAVLGGPLVTTPADTLLPRTAYELRRLAPKKIYLTGDTRSLNDTVERSLREIAPTERLAGIDRYATGRQIVRTAFTNSEHAIIATGKTFPDALAATGAAGSRKAPVVLVNGLEPAVPSETVAMLRDLGVRTISIVGDDASVSTGIETQLQSLGFVVARFGGSGRYETAALINNAYFPGRTSAAFITNGTNFPDALSAAAVAGRLGAPIYTTLPQCLPEVIRDSLDARAPSARAVMGDVNSVATAPENGLACLTLSPPSIGGTATVGSTLVASVGAVTPGAQISYRWFANGALQASGAALVVTTSMANTTITVEATGTKAGYVATSAISPGAYVPYPERVSSPDSWSCPSWAPIKGNQSSMIYHVPGGQYYERTNAEECFRTEAAAVAAGYRKSKL